MSKQREHEDNYLGLLIHVLLTLFITVLKLYTSTSEGKDNLLKVLPIVIKEEVLVKIGHAYTQD